MSELRISKIKWDGARLRIEYGRERPAVDGEQTEPDLFVVHCGDRPSRALLEALAALEKDCNAICEFRPPVKLTVRGVSLTWARGIMGAVVTVFRHVSTANSPIVINTPHLPAEPAAPGAGGHLMPAGMAERLRILLEEAGRYVLGGAREQPGLGYDPPDAGVGGVDEEARQ